MLLKMTAFSLIDNTADDFVVNVVNVCVGGVLRDMLIDSNAT